MRKQPISPKKVWTIVAAIWLVIDTVCLMAWLENWMSMRDFILCLILLNVQPLATLFVELSKTRKQKLS